MMKEFTLPGLPINASAQGAPVDHLILAMHILMITLFVGWFAYFVFVLFRFNKRRNPVPDYQGVKNHASTYIEIVVALIEFALLIGLAYPVWARNVDQFPDAKSSTVIKVIAQQFRWNGWYPGANGVFVRNNPKLVTPVNPFGFDQTDPNFKDNFVVGVDFYVPVNKPVIAYISSLDVIHSFSCRPMRAMQDAIPGMSIPLHFTPARLGTYEINCAQLCGSGHYSMKGTLTVLSQEDYQKWLAGKTKGAVALAKSDQ